MILIQLMHLKKYAYNMKTLNNYINENLNSTESRNLDSIIKANNVDVDKSFFFKIFHCL